MPYSGHGVSLFRPELRRTIPAKTEGLHLGNYQLDKLVPSLTAHNSVAPSRMCLCELNCARIDIVVRRLAVIVRVVSDNMILSCFRNSQHFMEGPLPGFRF